jgi:CRISPR-associated endonuclease/helicase Cas3
LRRLAELGRSDATLDALIDGATTPEPLRPALNRALVDAWSMTALETHTGRPEVAPWLRGWVVEPPQTTIIWRTHLPLRIDTGGRATIRANAEIEDFFEAAPPHESEKLETETYRVVDWLQKRARELIELKREAPRENGENEAADDPTSAPDDVDVEEPTKQTVARLHKLQRDQIVAMTLSSSGDYEGHFTVGELAHERKGKDKDKFFYQLIGRTLVIDARFAGLKDGMLHEGDNDLPETADASDSWSRQAQFRVRRAVADGDSEAREDGWRFEDAFVLRRSGEGNPLELLVVEHFREFAQREDGRSISKPQELSTHQQWARREALRIANAVGLSSAAAAALAVGAGLHDEGKKAPRWQRAFKAPRDAQRYGLIGPLAKTRGPIDQAILGGYRHEFGSLRYLAENADFKALPDEWRDLVMHLVAAHHGRARPMIETRGCDDGPPSVLEERARDVALRFAELQKRWGPWGCAWWEALMRAADQQASRRLDEEC